MTLPTIERPYKEDGKQGKGLVSHGDLVDSRIGRRGSERKAGVGKLGGCRRRGMQGRGGELA